MLDAYIGRFVKAGQRECDSKAKDKNKKKKKIKNTKKFKLSRTIHVCLYV